MREKLEVSGQLNVVAPVLCHDTASDGPGSNSRRAEDSHGKGSATLAADRKEAGRESLQGCRVSPRSGLQLQ